MSVRGCLIYKEQLDIVGEQELRLPRDSKILSCQMQNGRITVWFKFLKDYKDIKEKRTIYIIGTGHEFDDNKCGDYLGSVQDRMFVWHIFDSYVSVG